jgi:hypothetical protein
MVTGTPIRPPIEFSSNTLAWAEDNDEVDITRGVIQSWDDYWTHTRSLGMSLEEAQETYQSGEDILLDFRGKQVFIGAGHFQFIALKEVLDKVTPFPSTVAMGNERELDSRVNELGLLRLSLTERSVQHLGNAPDREILVKHQDIRIPERNIQSPGNKERFFEMPLIKRVLLKIYNLIFEIYNN